MKCFQPWTIMPARTCIVRASLFKRLYIIDFLLKICYIFVSLSVRSAGTHKGMYGIKPTYEERSNESFMKDYEIGRGYHHGFNSIELIYEERSNESFMEGYEQGRGFNHGALSRPRRIVPASPS